MDLRPWQLWTRRRAVVSGCRREDLREDLKYNPRNGRSLFGLWRSLEAQGRTADAARAGAEFRRAWAVADVTLRIGDL
jgi:hypothetical protein